MEIRRVNTEDVPAINRLSKQLGYTLTNEETAAHIAYISQRDDHAVFVAINEGVLTGWIHACVLVFVETPKFVEIAGLVVDEQCRGKGIGKALLDAVKHWTKQRGIQRLTVRTNVKRKDAHRFYMREGFAEVKEQKVYEVRL